MQLFQRNNLLCKVNKSLPYSGKNSKYPWGYCSELIFLFICSQPKLWIIHLFKIEMDLNKKETFNIFPPPLPLPSPLPSTGICFFWVYSCSPPPVFAFCWSIPGHLFGSLELILLILMLFQQIALCLPCFSQNAIFFPNVSAVGRVVGRVRVRVITIKRYLMLKLNFEFYSNSEQHHN